jgi:hypothetical protein
MSMLVRLEPQPEFPNQDLTEPNAELLELMLANASLVETMHLAAESASWVYKLGHPAIRRAGERLEVLQSKSEAFSHGVSTYEAIAALLSTVPERCEGFTVNTNAAAIAVKMPEDKLVNYIDEARQHFLAETPRAAAVVDTSARRFFRDVASYAVYGAALARQFELEGTEA